MSNTASQDELKESIKRFCRTDEAADNLVALIKQREERLVREALIAELKKVLCHNHGTWENCYPLKERIATLTEQQK